MNEDAYARYVVVKEPDTKNRSLRTARAGVREQLAIHLTRLCSARSDQTENPLDVQSF